MCQKDTKTQRKRNGAKELAPLFGMILFSLCPLSSAQTDTSNLRVQDVIISGNEITKDDIILREMQLKKGKKFSIEKYTEDVLSIYNLGLFTKVEILPVAASSERTPSEEKSLILDVQVQERWYILPLPQAGIEDGEWAKKWVGLNVRWDNFRGRNETVSLGFRILYNPFIRASYSVPWIGEKLHLFASIGGGYSKTRNKSLQAIGRTTGGEIISAEEQNYDNTEYEGKLTVGKYVTQQAAFFGVAGYEYLKVSQPEIGRTISASGIDKYAVYGGGVKYDSRDILEFTTKGYCLRTDYLRYVHLTEDLDFGRLNFESQSFIPIYLSEKYYVTAASRLFTSFATDPTVPLYKHQYLGYSDDYVRGWKGAAFEGEDKLTVYNELRIPIIQPDYLEAEKLPLIKEMPIIGRMFLKYGLYLTLLYDIGAVWYKGTSIFDTRFVSGTGIGLNVVLPFGYIARAEWAFRLGKPVVGQVGFSLSAKF
jgi:outer membrane protein assembly factor BamA